MALYTNARMEINSTLMLQVTSLEVTRNSGAIDQHTMPLGWAGESPGSPMMNIRADNAVPSAGLEFDAGVYMASLTEVSVTIYLDNQTLTTRGIINQDTLRKGVDQNASYSFEMKAKFTPIQGQWLSL